MMRTPKAIAMAAVAVVRSGTMLWLSFLTYAPFASVSVLSEVAEMQIG